MATHAPPARHLIWGWTNIGGHHISNACISWKERKRREDTELGERERERCCTPLPPTTPQGPLPFSNHLVPISGVDRTAATHLRTLVNRAAKMDFEKWASGMESNRSVNRNRLSQICHTRTRHVSVHIPTGKLFFATTREKRLETFPEHSSIRCRE